MLPIGALRRFCKSLSLRTKLLIVIALPMAILVTIVLVVAAWIEIQQTKQSMVTNTTSIIRAMSQDFERIDLLEDQSVAVDIVDRLQSFQGIERVYVYDQRAEVDFS